jgi:hypothetical protein
MLRSARAHNDRVNGMRLRVFDDDGGDAGVKKAFCRESTTSMGTAREFVIAICSCVERRRCAGA